MSRNNNKQGAPRGERRQAGAKKEAKASNAGDAKASGEVKDSQAPKKAELPAHLRVVVPGPLDADWVAAANKQLDGLRQLEVSANNTGGETHAREGASVKVLSSIVSSTQEIARLAGIDCNGMQARGRVFVLAPSAEQAMAMAHPKVTHIIPDEHELNRSAAAFIATPVMHTQAWGQPARAGYSYSVGFKGQDILREFLPRAAQFLLAGEDLQQSVMVMVDVAYHLCTETRAMLYATFPSVIVIGRSQTPARLSQAQVQRKGDEFIVIDPVQGDGAYTGYYLPELEPGCYAAVLGERETIVRSSRKQVRAFLTECDVSLTLIQRTGSHAGMAAAPLMPQKDQLGGLSYYRAGGVVFVAARDGYVTLSASLFRASISYGTANCHADYGSPGTIQEIARQNAFRNATPEQAAAVQEACTWAAHEAAGRVHALASQVGRAAPKTIEYAARSVEDSWWDRLTNFERTIFEPRLYDVNRMWWLLIWLSVLVGYHAFCHLTASSRESYFRMINFIDLPIWALIVWGEEKLKRRYPWLWLVQSLWEAWAQGDGLVRFVFRAASHYAVSRLPFARGFAVHWAHNSSMSLAYGAAGAHGTLSIVAGALSLLGGIFGGMPTGYLQSELHARHLKECCSRGIKARDLGYADLCSREAVMLSSGYFLEHLAPSGLTAEQRNYHAELYGSSMAPVFDYLFANCESAPFGAALHLGRGLDLKWAVHRGIGLLVAPTGATLTVEELFTRGDCSVAELPSLAELCGGEFEAKERIESSQAQLRLRAGQWHCPGHQTLYLVGGFNLRDLDEFPCAMTVCGCPAALQVAFTRYQRVKPYLGERKEEIDATFREILLKEWFHTLKQLPIVHITKEEFADHLDGAKRAAFLAAMDGQSPSDHEMTLMVKRDQKAFSLKDTPRPLVYNSPVQLAHTGPNVHALERVVWQQWDWMFSKWAGAANDIAVRTRDMVAFFDSFEHVYTVEADVTAADASATPAGHDVWAIALEQTRAVGRAAQATFRDVVTQPAAALSYVDAKWWAEETSRIMHGGRARFGKFVVGAFSLGEGMIATGKSKTNFDQTGILALVARHVLDLTFPNVSSWLEPGPSAVKYASWRTGDDDLTILGTDRPLEIDATAEQMRCAWAKHGYDVKLTLKSGALPFNATMCSCFFYPAVVDGVDTRVPFQKLGRFFQRSSTIGASVSRRALESVVAGWVKGYEAQAYWLTPIRIWVDTFKRHVSEAAYEAADATAHHYATAPSTTLVEWSSAQDSFIGRLYGWTQEQVYELYGEIARLRLGALFDSELVRHMIRVEA